MLVFSRRCKEAFMIGKDIKITILRMNRNQVQVGITAPAEIEVHREEIFNKIQKLKEKKPVNDYCVQGQVK